VTPKTKVPISKERIAEAKKQIEDKNYEGALNNLRKVNEGLQNYLKRMK
jgi:hypothetical protein